MFKASKFWGTSDTGRTRRVASNVFGLFVLATILIAIGVRSATHQVAVNQTKRDLDALAKYVADNDRKTLMSWARGEWKDQWNNTFAIEHNGDVVQFCSSGPDKKYGTKDDILGAEHTKVKMKYLPIIEEDPPEAQKSPGMMDRAWDMWKGWRSREK